MKTLHQVRGLRDSILALARHHGVRHVRLFGSVVRNAEGVGSDVDFLVDMQGGRSLLDLVGFEQDLEELLGCRVDVVVEGGISPYLERHILHEAVPL